MTHVYKCSTIVPCMSMSLCFSRYQPHALPVGQAGSGPSGCGTGLHKNELYWKGPCVILWQSVPPVILTEIQSTSFTEPVHDYQILPLWRQDSMSGTDITLCSRTLVGKSKAATDPRLNQAVRDSSCLGLKFSQWATVYLCRNWDRIAVVRYGSRVVSPVLSHTVRHRHRSALIADSWVIICLLRLIKARLF